MSEKKDEEASAWSGHRRQLDVMASLSGKKRAKAARALMPAQQARDSPAEDPWLTLRRAFDRILENQSVDQGFDELYRDAYTMVARNKGQRLYYGLRQAVTEHLASKVRILVLAGVGEDFLQILHQAWTDHQKSMGIISQILMYMERVYVPENNVDGVHKMGVLLFRDEVARCAAVRDRLRETMLGLVKTEREGKRVDRRSLKKACGMLVALGIDSREVYEEDFEKPFLEESAKFYALRGQEYIKTNDVSEYVAQVEQHISEELERAKQCLDESTAVRVVEVMIIELVEKCMEAIVDMDNSGVEHMLRNHMMDDLARVYRLLKCVEGGVQRLLESVSKLLRNIGASIVNEMGDSMSLIPKLMELRDYFDHVVQHSFNEDQLAKRTISTDFAYILSLAPKSPKHLSSFLDDLLQTGIKNMTKEASDHLLDRVVAMLRSLQEKDLFERYYKQRLAKRLLLNKSASNEAEKTMVVKLRKACGRLFTYRTEVMFRDVHISKNTMQEFKTAISRCKMNMDGVEVNVRVLTTGFWPLPAVTQQIILPTKPWRSFQTFRRFYLAKHNCRQLNLQPHLGWAEMSAVFYGPAKNEPSTSQVATPSSSGELKTRAYTIQVSTYQMCVLMLFNSHERMSYENIASETNIPETSLVRALTSLCTGKDSEPLLTKTPASSQIEKDHVFAVNDAFTHGVQEVKLESTSSGKNSVPESNGSVINAEEDRRYDLEAAIVRIMKARKRLSHDGLFAEVQNSLQAKYNPSPDVFRRKVDALIEREYLGRATEDAGVYNYLP